MDTSSVITLVNTLENDPDVPPKRLWFVYILTFFTQLTLINQGYDMGAISGAVLLAQDIDYMRLTRVWKQLIMAGSLPSAAVFSLIGAFLSDKYGRRKGIMAACMFTILGSVVSGSASNRESLLIGRILIGCGTGCASPAAAVYVAECSPARMRGRLIGMSQPFLTVGILSGMIIAALFSSDKTNGWRYLLGVQGVFCVIQLFALQFLPESPHWFVQQARNDEARKSLVRIRKTQNVQEELQEMETNCKEIQESNEKVKGNVFLKMIQIRSIRWAMLVGCGVRLAAEFSGGNTVVFYSGIILQMSGLEVTHALWSSVLVHSISLTFAIIGVWLIDTVGRRKLAIIGLLGLFFSSVCLGTTFLMEAIYSPSVNATGDLMGTTCSTYSRCDECIADTVCGFCYEDKPAAMTGTCLPVSDTPRLSSELGACNSSLALSKYSMKWAYDYCPISFSWVALIGLALFLMFYAVGMGPLPRIINAEIYPLWARSTGSGIGSMLGSLCNLVVAVSFLSFIELIQNYGVFYVMASVALIGSVFCFFILPETKNKSLEEMDALFSSDNDKV